MRKFLKYLRIGIICLPRVAFEYFQWILPCSRNPERKPLEYRFKKARSLVIFVTKHMKLNLNYELIKKEGEPPYLYVGNHLSALDPLIMIAVSPNPISFVAKLEAKKIIVVGRFIKAIDGAFLDRDDPFQAVKVFRFVRKRMAEGVSYAIFPEGTRQKEPYKGELLPFHPGALKLAHMAKCPVVFFNDFGSFHAFDNRKGKSHPVYYRELRFLPYEEIAPLSTVDISDMASKEITVSLRECLQKDLDYYAQGLDKKKAPKWWEDI